MSEQLRTALDSLSITPGSHNTIEADVRNIVSENELEDKLKRVEEYAKPWYLRDYAENSKSEYEISSFGSIAFFNYFIF
jgi:endo-alpha-1,4-polygalactosaminidase (GH114 family)